uniref:Uncharacterized protein n=1 Tax=Lepeophtheirus salmonis TaxID=72036 RepID=A0A0K2U2E9_LEPSM
MSPKISPRMAHLPFDLLNLSSPLRRETLPKHHVSTPMLDGGDFSSS